MTDGENSHEFIADPAEQDRIGKAMQETSPDIELYDGVLPRIKKDAIYRGVGFEPQRVAQSRAELVVVRNGAIQVGFRLRVELHPHFLVPPVR